MGEAIGESLPLAIGIALSPFPIVAVVLILTTPLAKTNGPAFVFGWLLGLAAVGAIVLGLAGPSDASDSSGPATWVSWVQIALGALLLLLAVKQFRGRPQGDEEPPVPKWMGTVDHFKPLQSIGVGALLAGANPKNLLLAVGGASAIAETGIAGSDQAIAYAVFAVIATLGVGIPVAFYLVKGEAARGPLEKLKTWMSHNNAVIVAVLCLIIGVKLMGTAIGPLTN